MVSADGLSSDSPIGAETVGADGTGIAVCGADVYCVAGTYCPTFTSPGRLVNCECQYSMSLGISGSVWITQIKRFVVASTWNDAGRLPPVRTLVIPFSRTGCRKTRPRVPNALDLTVRLPLADVMIIASRCSFSLSSDWN